MRAAKSSGLVFGLLWVAVGHSFGLLWDTLNPEPQIKRSGLGLVSLTYEPSSEPIHIYAK